MASIEFSGRLCSECYATVHEGGELRGTACAYPEKARCLKKLREKEMTSPVEYVRKYEFDKPGRKPVGAPYDAVENPEHYAQHAIQPIEFIMANKLGYCEGNVVKYVCRHNLKGGVEDLKKARNYLNILIEEAEKNDCPTD